MADDSGEYAASSSAVVYRFFDETGRLLYVGMTSVGVARWFDHSISQPWWSEVANATVSHFASVEEALDVERLAIINEDPLHNVTHKHKARPRTVIKPRRRGGSVYRESARGRWIAQVSSGPRGGRTVRRIYRHSREEAELALLSLNAA